MNVVNLWTHQQLGYSILHDQRALIDQRILTLRESRKHKVVPWKNRAVGASSLAFDDAEQRFLLCGSCIGDVSIIDMESPVDPIAIPLNHTVYRSPKSQRHRFLVSGCQFYPVDSGIFVTASMDQEVRLWDSETMRVIDKYKNETAVLDCHWGMPNTSGLIAIVLGSSCVRLIDPRTRNHIQHMRWKGKFVKCLQWMQAPSHLLLAGSETGNMILWDVRSGRSELAEVVSTRVSDLFHTNERRTKPKKAHSCCITSIRCSRDGRYVVSMSTNRHINVWDSYSMQLEQSVKIAEEGQCTSIAGLGDEGNDLYGFVGVDTDLMVCRLTANAAKSSRQQHTTRSASQLTTSVCSTFAGNKVIRAHFKAIMVTAYRRTHQQVVTSSGDGATIVLSPEMDEVLPEKQRVEIEAFHRDDFSDED